MKKISLFIFLTVLAFAGFSQLKIETVGAGQYAVRTIGNSDFVTHFPSNGKVAYYEPTTSVNVVDTVFYITSGSALDTVSNFTRPAGKKAAWLLQRGATFDTTLVISDDSIFVGSYGNGEKPVIDCSTVIDNFESYSGNIWRAHCPKSITQLFSNDERLTLARTPNADSDYYKITTLNTSVQFTSTYLQSQTTDYYSGAEAHIQTNLWVLQPKTVTASSGNTLTIESAPSYAIANGDKFFLNNKLEFLDSAGEWWYDAVNDSVYVWLPSNANPNELAITGSSVENAIVIENVSSVFIANLKLRHSSSHAITTTSNNFSHLSVSKCEIYYPGGTGIELYDALNWSTNVNLKYNTITGAANSGIRGRIMDSQISNNTITDIAEFCSIGVSGIGLGIGISVDGDYQDGGNNTISYNRLERIGYNGISFRGTNTIVEYNYVYKPCDVLTDGAGIYTYTGQDTSAVVVQGSIIRYNLVVNGNGYFDEATNKYGCHLYYLDEGTREVTLSNNFGFTGGYSGLYMHDVVFCNVFGNYFYDSPIGILVNSIYADNTISGNTVINSSREGVTAWWASPDPQRLLFQASGSDATLSNNYYYSPYVKEKSFYLNGSNVDFTTWQSNTGQDATSTCDYFTVYRKKKRVFFNETTVSKSITLNADTTFFDYDGNVVESPLVLQPLTGVVLLAETPTLLNDNLVAYWAFDQNTGTNAIDSSGNELHATLLNNPAWVSGAVNSAVDYSSASSQYASAPDSDVLTLTNNFTYSFYINPDATVAAFKPLNYKKNEINISVYNGLIFADIYTGGTSTYGRCQTTAAVITPGQWNHVVITCDSTSTVNRTSLHIYANGDEKSITYTQNSGTIAITNTTNAYLIARQSTNGFYFDGLIDEHKIWNTKLGIKEIVEDYNNMLNGESFKQY